VSTFLSPDQVASQLGVHVKTVRRYVREGRLKAVRIGKHYRVATSDLALLTGQSASALAADPATLHTRHVDASTVVLIEAIGVEDAQRVIQGLGGATKGRDKHCATPLRVDTLYDEQRARLKVIVTGSLATTTAVLKLIAALAE
jgi:excisionase family DNA binding protein